MFSEINACHIFSLIALPAANQTVVSDKRFSIRGQTPATFYDPYGPTVIYALATSPQEFLGQIAGAVGQAPDVTELRKLKYTTNLVNLG